MLIICVHLKPWLKKWIRFVERFERLSKSLKIWIRFVEIFECRSKSLTDIIYYGSGSYAVLLNYSTDAVI
jgi:hypothetical protein